MRVARGEECGDRRNAVSTLTVLHHDRLPPALRQALRQKAAHNVRTAARRKRDDQADGPLRPWLGESRRCGDCKSKQKCGKAIECAHGSLAFMSCWTTIVRRSVCGGRRRGEHEPSCPE